MRIYLAKPGGPVLGPYTLKKINADLAARTYKDDEFWAWQDGLGDWVPLYSIGGVLGATDTTLFFAKRASEASMAGARPPQPPGPDTTMFLAKPSWLQAAQHAAEPKSAKGEVQQEIDTVVLAATAPEREKSQAPREPGIAKAVVCTAPTPRAEQAAKELSAQMPAGPLAGVGCKAREDAVEGADTTGSRNQPTPVGRRVTVRKAPTPRGSSDSAGRTKPARRRSRSRKRITLVTGRTFKSTVFCH